jgi:hypothetical protein
MFGWVMNNAGMTNDSEFSIDQIFKSGDTNFIIFTLQMYFQVQFKPKLYWAGLGFSPTACAKAVEACAYSC